MFVYRLKGSQEGITWAEEPSVTMRGVTCGSQQPLSGLARQWRQAEMAEEACSMHLAPRGSSGHALTVPGPRSQLVWEYLESKEQLLRDSALQTLHKHGHSLLSHTRPASGGDTLHSRAGFWVTCTPWIEEKEEFSNFIVIHTQFVPSHHSIGGTDDSQFDLHETQDMVDTFIPDSSLNPMKPPRRINSPDKLSFLGSAQRPGVPQWEKMWFTRQEGLEGFPKWQINLGLQFIGAFYPKLYSLHSCMQMVLPPRS